MISAYFAKNLKKNQKIVIHNTTYCVVDIFFTIPENIYYIL